MNLKPFHVLSLILVALLLASAPLPAADDGDDDDGGFTPRTGAPPAQRTGGASRDATASHGPTVSILAPAESVGMTGREQPVIYWYLSKATDAPVAIGINKKDRSAVLELTLDGKKEAGLHALDLGKVEEEGEKVKLEPGEVYDVAIMVATDRDQASKNPTATARITRVDPKDLSAAARKHEGDPAKLAPVYGKEGLWFDYIDALNRAIQADPKAEELRKQRDKALAAQRLVWRPDGALAEVPKGRDAGAKK